MGLAGALPEIRLKRRKAKRKPPTKEELAFKKGRNTWLAVAGGITALYLASSVVELSTHEL